MRRRDHERLMDEMRGRCRYLERQVEQLMDRLMYMADQPWTPPPADLQETPEPELPDYDFDPSALDTP